MKNKSKLKARRKVFYSVLIAIAVAGLLLWRLGNLTGGISDREMAASLGSSTLVQIAQNPAFLPLNLLRWAALWLPIDPTLAIRLPSVLLALITLAAAVYILRRWYGPRTAMFGLIIFATSAWFLHAGRLGSADIAYLLALPALLASHSMLYDHTDRKWTLYLWLAIQLCLLYIPGMVWLVLLNVFWQRSELHESWTESRRPFQAGYTALLSLVILAPMIYGLTTNFSSAQALYLAGLPTSLPQWQNVLANARDAMLFIAVHGHAPKDVWLNHLPVLDAFLTGMLLIGIYFYAIHLRATRTHMIMAFGLLGLILIAIGGPVRYGLIVPLLYFVVAAGIAYFLHLWLKVFPRNPLARGVGIAMLALAIAMSSIYSLRQYFVAWPHHAETQAVFSQNTPPASEL